MPLNQSIIFSYIFHCFLERDIRSFPLFQLTLLLFVSYFLSIRHDQTLAVVCKNSLLTVDRFAYLGFCWYFFLRCKLQNHSIIFSCASTQLCAHKLYIYIYIYGDITDFLAKSAGSVEYTDCFSAEM